ncbi:MAG: helix-turn-helix transcriptional regulator [Clostridium paraputrificum]|nr:helix-turn-helix transcriptional regulator [Clostridium paraputrificum]MDY4720693.1 helix-turn-helix transcriptional regulator [Clostridium paraputrificum]
MIRCNLAVLLAERNLRISKVSEMTKISRTTLTALSNNYSQGIQFDTINTLCSFLNITPDQLISFIPLEIEIARLGLYDSVLDIDLRITRNSRTYICPLGGFCHTDIENNILHSINIELLVFEDYDDREIKRTNSVLISSFKSLTTPFRNEFENKLTDEILSHYSEYMKSDNRLNISFTWDNKLTQ